MSRRTCGPKYIRYSVARANLYRGGPCRRTCGPKFISVLRLWLHYYCYKLLLLYYYYYILITIIIISSLLVLSLV